MDHEAWFDWWGSFCVFSATGFMFLVTEPVLGLHTNNQPWIVWAAPGAVAVSFFLLKGILSPVGPAHLNQQGCVGPKGFNRSSRALALWGR